jgi:hypothetical protein
LSYLWQFSLPGAFGNIREDLTMLAVSCVIPARERPQQEYSVGGQTMAHLGGTRRGGLVTAKFIEVEGGLVDLFFRAWDAQIDTPEIGSLVLTPTGASVIAKGYSRNAQGGVSGVGGYSRNALVTLYRRSGSESMQLSLRGLKLVSFGGYNLTYEGSSAAVVDVSMWCDSIERK